MARYVLVVLRATSPVTYLYEDPEKALAKVRTLQRQAVDFQLQDGFGASMSTADLEKRAGS